jgi:hypothetical protein
MPQGLPNATNFGEEIAMGQCVKQPHGTIESKVPIAARSVFSPERYCRQNEDNGLVDQQDSIGIYRGDAFLVQFPDRKPVIGSIRHSRRSKQAGLQVAYLQG